MAGEVDVVGRLAEDIHNVVHRSGHPGPPLGPGAGVVPQEMASETLDSEGTRWKSGDHCRSAARPQKEAKIPLTEGSFPYPFIRANCPATLSIKAIQKGLRRLQTGRGAPA